MNKLEHIFLYLLILHGVWASESATPFWAAIVSTLYLVLAVIVMFDNARRKP